MHAAAWNLAISKSGEKLSGYDIGSVVFVEVRELDTAKYRKKLTKKVRYFTDNQLSLLGWDAKANTLL